MSKTKAADLLISKGLKEEDVSRAIREMSFYFNQVYLLRKHTTKIVEGLVHSTGDMKAEMVIVSDKPEPAEMEMGHSGFGSYSLFLSIFLRKLNLSYQDVFWTQAIRDPNTKVTMAAIENDYDYLFNEITVIKPAVILALGTTAISSLTQSRLSIDKAIGNEYSFQWGNDQIPIIPLRHPRSIIKGDQFKAQTLETWKTLKNIDKFL